jgi:hypothetical protein
MVGTIIIKAEDVAQAKLNWGDDIVNCIFEDIKGTLPWDLVHKYIENEETEKVDCLMLLFKEKLGPK